MVNINLKNSFLYILFFSVTLFILPKSIFANDSIRIELDEILFFESGKDVPVKKTENILIILNQKHILLILN